MKQTYDLKTVYNYIWGNDIPGYNIEDLENDPLFMFSVLSCSKDKRMYELCSDTVKKNYDFVKGVVKLFDDDFDFATTVAETYLSSLTEDEKKYDISYHELNIIMSNLSERDINEFVLRATAFYEAERVRMAICANVIKETDNSIDISESKEGFIFSAAQYEESEIIVDFIAKRMINDALYGERTNNLEYLIHSRFKSVEDLEEYGEVNFLHNYISMYDKSLELYAFDTSRIKSFSPLFNEILKNIEVVKRGWPMYMARLNSWRVSSIEYEVSKYMLDNEHFGNLSCDDVIRYVANKYGVLEVFKKYAYDFDPNYDEEKYKVLEFGDVSSINVASDLVKRLFSTDVNYDDYDDYDDKITPIQDRQESLSEKCPGIIKFHIIDTTDENKNSRNKL